MGSSCVDATKQRTNRKSRSTGVVSRLGDSGIVSVTASDSRCEIEAQAKEGPETITEIWIFEAQRDGKDSSM